MEAELRIAVIDANPIRAVILEEGLRAAGYRHSLRVEDTFGPLERIGQTYPHRSPAAIVVPRVLENVAGG